MAEFFLFQILEYVHWNFLMIINTKYEVFVLLLNLSMSWASMKFHCFLAIFLCESFHKLNYCMILHIHLLGNLWSSEDLHISDHVHLSLFLTDTFLNKWLVSYICLARCGALKVCISQIMFICLLSHFASHWCYLK